MESRFGIIDGVIRTRVGYAGGLTKHPTYDHLGDHTEAVQVDYDPRRISYAALLTVFWQNHRPTQRAWSRQYRNVVFFHNDRQRQAAFESKAALERKIGVGVHSQVAPLRTFHMAEDYHQKYYLKGQPDLAAELTGVFPRQQDFVNSTAVTRVNGYLGGHGNAEQFAREIDALGLSADGRQTLFERFRQWGHGVVD